MAAIDAERWLTEQESSAKSATSAKATVTGAGR
jgi:hypothetical protein